MEPTRTGMRRVLGLSCRRRVDLIVQDRVGRRQRPMIAQDAGLSPPAGRRREQTAEETEHFASPLVKLAKQGQAARVHSMMGAVTTFGMLPCSRPPCKRACTDAASGEFAGVPDTAQRAAA